MKKTAFSLAFFLCISVCIFAQSAIVDLKCEYLISPIGIDAANPRLAWKISDPVPGAKQISYRVVVGIDSVAVAQGKGASWDSGEIASDASLVAYQGEKLLPFTRYFWKVTGAGNHGAVYQSKEIVSFETGMMGTENWKGAWISDNIDVDLKPAPYFRKEFDTKKKIKSARAYIAVGGLYELYLNGEKVGNHYLDPVFTRYDRRTIYVTHDVTAQIKDGKNAVGVLLGNGWYNHQSMAVWDFDKAPWRNRPAFCMDLRITYDDGSVDVISSERNWKTALSPVTLNSIYTAEHYDFRDEKMGWDEAGFDDSDWKNAIYRTAPSQHIVPQSLHPIRQVEEVTVKTLACIDDTTYVFDLGRNIAGVTRINLMGERGTTVRLKHGERLHDNGRVDLSNIDVYHRPADNGDPFQTDIIILSGGNDTFTPKFNYKGFRYIEVTSDKPIELEKTSLVAYFTHSDVPQIGKLSSSSTMIDNIWWATNNSYLSNLYGYPTDCPQREKNGWTGDGHFAIETALYNFDGITVYEKWLADHRDEQQPNGVLPDIIPTGGWGYGTANGTDWTSTIAIIPWNLYLFYGDIQPLADNYQNIKRYVDYVTRISPGGLTTWGRGDWVPVKSKSSLELTSSIYYYADAVILAKAAKLLQHETDYAYYTLLADQIKRAINDKYLNAETGVYATGTQTELSVPLLWGVVPDDMVTTVAARLAERVAQDGFRIDVGVLGAKAILNALSENGYPDIAYRLASREEYPSWGWWIVNGATTLYENWDIDAERDISHNHMMFGEIGAWFYKALGGIRIDELHPGFKRFVVEPHIVDGLDYFEASFEGPQGEISSKWRKQGAAIVIEISVPANSIAIFKWDTDQKPNAFLGEVTYDAGVLELESGSHTISLQ